MRWDQPETESIRAKIAVIYHQLGITAQDSGRLEEAGDWYRKSLTISEELGERPGLALTTPSSASSPRPGMRPSSPWRGTSAA